MQLQMTEEFLEKELLEGEQILWSGRPNPGARTSVSPTRVFLILGFIFLPIGLLVVVIGLIFLLAQVFPPQAAGASLGFLIPGGVFFLLGLIYLVIGLVGRVVPGNSLYAITDRRVIILRTGNLLRVTSYGKRSITQIQRVERPDGSGDLVFSGAPSLYGAYNNSQSGYSSYTAGRQGLFAGIPNVRMVEQKLLNLVDQA